MVDLSLIAIVFWPIFLVKWIAERFRTVYTKPPPAGGTALVTGGSYGIGFEIAQQLAADGWNLVLVARNERRLMDAKRKLLSVEGVGRVETLPADLSVPAGPRVVFRELQDRQIEVDILVNNAGFGAKGPFWQLSQQESAGMVECNVAALTNLTRFLLPGMIERQRGRILNVASLQGINPGPQMAVYHATKSYVLSFSEAISYELRDSPVSCTALVPGPVATQGFERSGLKGSLWSRMGPMSAEEVAKAGYMAMHRGDRRVVPGYLNYIVSLISPLLPMSVALVLSNILLERNIHG